MLKRIANFLLDTLFWTIASGPYVYTFLGIFTPISLLTGFLIPLPIVVGVLLYFEYEQMKRDKETEKFTAEWKESNKRVQEANAKIFKERCYSIPVEKLEALNDYFVLYDCDDESEVYIDECRDVKLSLTSIDSQQRLALGYLTFELLERGRIFLGGKSGGKWRSLNFKPAGSKEMYTVPFDPEKKNHLTYAFIELYNLIDKNSTE